MFEMLPGYHTQNFVGEVFRLTESLHSDGKSFQWLDTYTQGNLNLQYESKNIRLIAFANNSKLYAINKCKTYLQKLHSMTRDWEK